MIEVKCFCNSSEFEVLYFECGLKINETSGACSHLTGAMEARDDMSPGEAPGGQSSSSLSKSEGQLQSPPAGWTLERSKKLNRFETLEMNDMSNIFFFQYILVCIILFTISPFWREYFYHAATKKSVWDIRDCKVVGVISTSSSDLDHEDASHTVWVRPTELRIYRTTDLKMFSILLFFTNISI